MRRFYYLCLVLLLCLNTKAQSDTEILSELRSLITNQSYKTGAEMANYFNEFVGDTLTISSDIDYIRTFISYHHEDTLWLTNKRKKAQLNRDYITTKVYKPQRKVYDNHYQFVTNTNDIRSRRWILEKAVKAEYNLKVNSFSSVKQEGSNLLVKDANSNAEAILLLQSPIPNDFIDKEFTFTIENERINRLIKQLVNKEVTAYNFSTSSYEKRIITGGSFLITFKANKTIYKMSDLGEKVFDFNANVKLTFKNKDGKEFEMDTRNNIDHFLKSIYTEAEFIVSTDRLTIDRNEEAPTAFVPDPKKPFDFDYIMGLTSNSAPITYDLRSFSNILSDNNRSRPRSFIPSDEVILIGKRKTADGIDYYQAYYQGKSFFIKTEDVELVKGEIDEEKVNILNECDYLTWRQFHANCMFLTKRTYENSLKKNKLKLKQFSEKGLAVRDYDIYQVSEYVEGKGFKFKIFNPTNIDIKYVTVNFVGYNAVDDPVQSGGKTIQKVRGIGPVEAKENASWSFDYVWTNDLVQYVKIKSIIVEYTNGTSKTIPFSEDLILDSRTYRDLYNPVVL